MQKDSNIFNPTLENRNEVEGQEKLLAPQEKN
jgi:hypothetical protein